jgi:fructose-1,6-bisphosphatase/inositol monophosphatase family enzyme
MEHSSVFSEPVRELVSKLEGAALDSAAYLVEAARSGARPEVWVKADHTLVMSLDLESQRRILSRLGTAYPVVAEEDESSHGLINGNADFFLVDPLDGTTSCKRFLGETGGHVGYGPLVGFVRKNRLVAAVFYSVPHRRLFTAVKGEGCYVSDVDFVSVSAPASRRKLVTPPCTALDQAGVLFFVGSNGESRVVQHLKNENAIENLYRFGGFANDCSRLAQGFEQVSVQFSIKPWDFSAVLLAAEAGLDVILDPLNRRVPLGEWTIEMNNPAICVQPGVRDELFTVIGRMKA